MAKIDIIVPVYNAEKYIRNCLDSVLSQSFQDFRIIVVDDKSPDRSLTVLRAYASSFPSKVKLIESPTNKGVSNARNIALDVSDAEYVTFLDSDDILAVGILEKVAEIIKKHNPDMITMDLQFNLMGLNGNFLGMKRPRRTNELIVPYEYKKQIYEERPNVTTKFIKRECIHSEFPVGVKWEDYAFTVPYLASLNSIYMLDEIGYFYTVNPLGTTTTDIFKVPTNILDIFTATDIINQNISDDLLTHYKDEMRIVRTMNCLQRVRDLAFATNISLEDKRDLVNALVQLITIREGDYQELEWYQFQKANSPFYSFRMNLMERLLDSRYASITDEETLKSKIKTLTKKNLK